MTMYFIPSETVIHPETREVMFQAGAMYYMSMITDAYHMDGMDNINGRVIMAKDNETADAVFDRFDG